MGNVDPAQEAAWAEERKFYLAKYWGPWRHEKCASRAYQHLTLDQRFREMYGETITEYGERLRAERSAA